LLKNNAVQYQVAFINNSDLGETSINGEAAAYNVRYHQPDCRRVAMSLHPHLYDALMTRSDLTALTNTKEVLDRFGLL